MVTANPPPHAAAAVAGTLRVFEDVAHLADGAARLMAERLSRLSQPVAVAISGGSTPGPLFKRLAQAPYLKLIDWAKIHWFWCDERMVARESPDSNYRLAMEAFLKFAPVPPENIHGVAADAASAEQAAELYDAELKRFYGGDVLDAARPLFELVLLGMGDDGHTASLLPGQPVLEVRDHWAAGVSKGRPQARVTLTYPALESSRAMVFLVAGADKYPALCRGRSGDAELPVARMRPQGEVIWMIDRAAAKGSA